MPTEPPKKDPYKSWYEEDEFPRTYNKHGAGKGIPIVKTIFGLLLILAVFLAAWLYGNPHY